MQCEKNACAMHAGSALHLMLGLKEMQVLDQFVGSLGEWLLIKNDSSDLSSTLDPYDLFPCNAV